MGMEPITSRAWAKLNLTLDVLGSGATATMTCAW